MTLDRMSERSRHFVEIFIFALMALWFLIFLVDAQIPAHFRLGFLLSVLGGFLLGIARWMYYVRPRKTPKPSRLLALLAGLVGVTGLMSMLIGLHVAVERPLFLI